MGIWPQRLESLFISQAAPESAWGLKEGVWEEFLKGILGTQQQDVLLAVMAVVPYNSKSNVAKIGFSCTLWPLCVALLFFPDCKSYRLKDAALNHWFFFMQQLCFFLTHCLHKEITSYGRAMQREKKLWYNGVEFAVTHLWYGIEKKKEISSIFKGCSSYFCAIYKCPR